MKLEIFNLVIRIIYLDKGGNMAKCTAPVKGHRTSSAAENCPACRTRRYGGYNSFSSRTSSRSSSGFGEGSGSRISSSGARKSSKSRKAPWAKAASLVFYTPAQLQTFTPVRKNVERRASKTELWDIFLCHAWDDRKGVAQELYDQLKAQGVSVWFSEKNILLGTSFLREIDKGLAKSRVGIVLVTPDFLKRVEKEGVADKELAVLLARDLLIPIIHNTTYDALLDVSPLLASRNGLDTAEESMTDVVAKLAELVKVDSDE